MTWTPNRKVGSGIAAGMPIAIAISYALRTWFGIELPPEMATAIGSIASFIIAWLVPSKA